MKQQHAISLLSLARESDNARNKLCEFLARIDANKTMRQHSYVPEFANFGADETLLREAIYHVTAAEDAAEAFLDVAARRKMSLTQEHHKLLKKIDLMGHRLYRNMWEISLDRRDTNLKNKLLKSLSVLVIWEDSPCTLDRLSYEKLAAPLDGVVAYEHCFGVTFMRYDKGKAKGNCWTVLRHTLENSVAIAKENFSDAVNMLSA